MATTRPKRPNGAGGEWSEQKPVRRLNSETGRYEPTGEARTIWKVSRTVPWTATDEHGVTRNGAKSIVAEGKDLAAAYRNLDRRVAAFREQQNPTAPMREQKVTLTLTLSDYFWGTWVESKRFKTYKGNSARGHLTRMRELMHEQATRQAQWRAENPAEWAAQNAKRPDLAQLVFTDTPAVRSGARMTASVGMSCWMRPGTRTSMCQHTRPATSR